MYTLFVSDLNRDLRDVLLTSVSPSYESLSIHLDRSLILFWRWHGQDGCRVALLAYEDFDIVVLYPTPPPSTHLQRVSVQANLSFLKGQTTVHTMLDLGTGMYEQSDRWKVKELLEINNDILIGIITKVCVCGHLIQNL